MTKTQPDNANLGVEYVGKIPKVVQRTDKKVLISFQPSPPANTFPRFILVRYVDGQPANTSKWPDPPHVAFANMNFEDLGRVEFFVKHYGISGHFCRLDDQAKHWFIDPALLQKWQARLRQGWHREGSDLWFHPRSITATAKDGRLELLIADLWTLVCVKLLIDRSAGRAKVCELENCKFLRYFIKARKDQRFCSRQCRAIHNMAVWRANPDNRLHERTVRAALRGKRSGMKRRNKKGGQ
jgi:hypothetical protein